MVATGIWLLQGWGIHPLTSAGTANHGKYRQCLAIAILLSIVTFAITLHTTRRHTGNPTPSRLIYNTAMFFHCRRDGFSIDGIKLGDKLPKLRHNLGPGQMMVEAHRTPWVYSLFDEQCHTVVIVAITEPNQEIVEVRSHQHASLEFDGQVLVRIGDPPPTHLTNILSRSGPEAVYCGRDSQGSFVEVSGHQSVTLIRLFKHR
jgi:hypothetical protein